MRLTLSLFCCFIGLFIDHCLEAYSAVSQCPTLTQSIPCQCEHILGLNLICDHLQGTDTLQEFLNSTNVNFTVLVILHSSVNHIPGKALNAARIKALYLRNGTFDALFDENDPQEVVNVEVLTIERVNFTGGFRWSSLKMLQDLWKLTIRKNKILKIDLEFVKFMSPCLVRLIMSETNTEDIIERAFLKFRNLKYLHLEKNKLHTLSRDMFPVPANIESLDFNNNRLTSLPSDFFTDMPQLNSVGLSGNQISVLSQETFSKIWFTVTHLSLRENPVKCDCSLKWIVKQKTSPILKGCCLGPKRLYGVKLRNLKLMDFIRC